MQLYMANKKSTKPKYTLLLFVFLFFLSCQQKEVASDYTEIAKVQCKCMRPVLDMNKKAQSLMQQGRSEEVQVLFSQMEMLSNESDACIKALEIKYGAIDGLRQEKAEEAMQQQCPDIAQMIKRKKQLERR